MMTKTYFKTYSGEFPGSPVVRLGAFTARARYIAGQGTKTPAGRVVCPKKKKTPILNG